MAPKKTPKEVAEELEGTEHVTHRWQELDLEKTPLFSQEVALHLRRSVITDIDHKRKEITFRRR